MQAFAAPQNPSVSYLAVYEPWSRESVVKATNGDVTAPLKGFKARCTNIECQSMSDGVYIEKKPPNVDHVEIVVEAEDTTLEPVKLSIPFSDDTPVGVSYVVLFKRKP